MHHKLKLLRYIDKQTKIMALKNHDYFLLPVGVLQTLFDQIAGWNFIMHATQHKVITLIKIFIIQNSLSSSNVIHGIQYLTGVSYY